MRTYEASHPWITFNLDMTKLDHRSWMLLGEAESKCAHIAGAPLQPDVAQKLHEIYLSKGVHGTASIEGNTLSEAQVLQRIRGELDLPESQAYLGREIDNIVEACNVILWDVHEDPTQLEITPERVKQFNKMVLHELELNDDDTVPGEIREHSVGVSNYRGVPAEDCDYLIDRMCSWINRDLTIPDPKLRFTVAVLRAIMAHLYIAWIHPFGDGNGRTARLVEFQLMVEAGIPFPAAHLLSDHYNQTRGNYYRALSRTSTEPFPVHEFINYALQGFVDQLRDQIDQIREQQEVVTWEHYVHGYFAGQETKARQRQKHLVLALPFDRDTPMASIRKLTPRLAIDYLGASSKMINRDLNALERDGLITRGLRGVRPRREVVKAFLPGRAPTPQELEARRRRTQPPVAS